jgi:hypothetical protein
VWYNARQIGQLHFASTNQDIRHSAWNSWLQAFRRRISSFSKRDKVDIEDSVGEGILCVSMAESFAGSGGDGACRVERHIALNMSVSTLVMVLCACKRTSLSPISTYSQRFLSRSSSLYTQISRLLFYASVSLL